MSIIIGIAGGSGSGKSTLAQTLLEANEGRVVGVKADDYYKARPGLSKAERDGLNFDHPEAIDFALLALHLSELKAGRNVKVPRYNFGLHRRLPESIWPVVEPKPIIIVEGILVLHDESIRNLCDYRLFVETPDDLRFIRRLERDMRDRDRTLESVREQWLTTVEPMYRLYCYPSRRYAHLIVPEGGENLRTNTVLMHGITSLLEAA